MSNKRIPQIHEDAIEIYIDKFNLYDKIYKYIGKDKDGLFLYDYIPNYNKERNVFNILNEKYTSYISNSEYNTNVEEDILELFKDGEIIIISEGIKKIETLIDSSVDKLFKLLSEVQGVEIKPYDRFDIKDNCITYGPYYLDKNFKRYDATSNSATNNEIILKGILTGEMKILKCKKTVVLTEDDIICLKYYLKNEYRYIANNKYIDFEEVHKLKGFKNEPKTEKRPDNRWVYNDYDEESNHYHIWLDIKDKLSFEHYDYPEIWDIEELLEQERVNND